MEEKNNGNDKVTTKNNQTKDQADNKKFGLILGVVIALIAMGAGYLYLNGDLKLDTAKEESAETTNDLPQPELLEEGEVVALVNGEEVLGASVNQQITILSQQLSFFDAASVTPEVLEQVRMQAVDSVVNTVLLKQKATEANIEVTEEEINNEYNQVVESLGGEDQITDRLAEVGVSKDQLRNTIIDNIMIQKYLDATEIEVEVTEEEIRAFYDEILANGNQEEAPAFEEVRSQLEDQLKLQKEQQSTFELMESLRAEADIEILI